MTSGRPFFMKRFFLCLILLFFANSSFGGQEGDLKNYFNNYYSIVKEGKKKSQDEVLADINKIVNRNFKDFDSLSIWLDKRFEPNGMSISLFWIEDINVLNCWLGHLVENDKDTKNVWGKEIRFNRKIIDKLEIRDYYYYYSKGKEAIETGTRNNIIYYNLEAFRIKAESIWDFFKSRELHNKTKRYEPSRINRIRRQFYYKTWLDLYLEEDKEGFINKVVGLLIEVSFFHEIGHIFANEHLMLEDEKEEEVVAFLTELRYGPLPYESLQTVISAAYQNKINYYNSACKEIIQLYIGGNIRQIKDMEKLLKLSKDDIRKINYK